jgi:hypothetical protein
MSLLQNSNAISSGSYDINNSLRFRASASAYLNRTPGSAGNRQIFTISVWLKRGTLGSDYKILSAYSADSDSGLFDLRFSSANVLYIGNWNTGLTTTAVFRDPSAWYHIVVAVDTTQATGSNRIKAYVNGVQYTLNGTAFDQNVTTPWNNNVTQNIGRQARTSDGYFDGYMAEFYNVDGQALTPSSFGETDTTTGVWKPKAYTGTYGTNGFYLKFSDIATTSGSNAGLGKDFSGNANYWTTNNISVTAGVTYDAMIDSPTLTSATVANYCVINPIKRNVCTISNANLTAAGPATYTKSVVASMSMPSGSGKYYWEAVFTRTSTTDGDVNVGIVSTTWNAGEATGSPSVSPGNTSDSWGVSGNNGNKINNGSGTSYGSSFASGDIIMVAYDAVNGSFYVGKNGTWFNSGVPASNTGYAFTGITTEVLPGFGMAYDSGSSIVNANFGQRPFSYTPPTGFVRLNTFNLPDSTIKKGSSYMDATTYTGTGASLSVTNAGAFKPDFVWVKGRSGATDHAWYDSVRGTTKQIESNTTTAETTEAQGLTAFGTGGFTVGTLAQMNTSAATYVGWQWQAGQGSTTSNTSGTITSTVSVNATAGFSVVTWSGNSTIGATIGHGLGVAPKLVIMKRRNGATNWQVWVTGFNSTTFLFLQSTNAVATAENYFNSTLPSSTLITLSANSEVNTTGGTYVAYCWAEIAGFSKFGSFTANNSADGNFIYLGFRPKWIMTKQTSGSGGAWFILDTSRNTFNVMNNILDANTSGAERNDNIWDATANGMKLRIALSGDFIYAAFAENPFKNSNAR